jgi:hypothetical protein
VLDRLEAQAVSGPGLPFRGEGYWYSAEWIPLAANATQTVTIPIQSDSDFVITHVVGTIGRSSTKVGGNFNEVEFQIETGRAERFWQEGPIRGDMFVGTAQDPHYLAAPVRLRLNDVLRIRATNLVGFANWLIIHFHGFRIFDAPELTFPRWPFYHRLDWVALGAGAQLPQTFTVRTVGAFAWTRIVGFSTGPFMWRVSDSGEGRGFSSGRGDPGNVQTPWLHGTATVRNIQEPYDLDWPIIFSPLSDVTFDCLDLSGAPNTIRLYPVGIYLGDELGKGTPAEILEALFAAGVGL